MGTPASFAVTATGNGALTYEWKRNGTPIAGATNSSYTIASVSTADAGNYSVLITDSDAPVESSPVAVLTVQTPVDIGTQPASAMIVQGSSHTMAVTATGTPPFTYQWKKNSANIPGATDPAYTVSNATDTDTGSYTAVVSNLLSGVPYSKTSAVADLIVVIPPSITAEPSTSRVAVGAPGARPARW